MNRAARDAAIEKILGGDLRPGRLIKAEIFEEVLALKRGEQAYGFLISKIRQELYNRGLYLSGEGLASSGCYEILAPEDNYWIAKLALARADRDLEGKMTLLANTNLEQLNDLQRRRHEGALREISIKLAAMRRAREFERKLKDKTIELEKQ
jgi:hypothetical protein